MGTGCVFWPDKQKMPGKPSLLNAAQRTALAQAFKPGLTPYLDGVGTLASM